MSDIVWIKNVTLKSNQGEFVPVDALEEWNNVRLSNQRISVVHGEHVGTIEYQGMKFHNIPTCFYMLPN